MRKNFQIMVVDDDREDHFIVLDYFKDLGIEEYVSFFLNGKEALRQLSAEEDQFLPRLIILDLNMPIMNGTQTLLELKRNPRFKQIPVIIFSTSENDNEKRKTLSFGALDYIVKPSTYEQGLQMMEIIKKYIIN